MKRSREQFRSICAALSVLAFVAPAACTRSSADLQAVVFVELLAARTSGVVAAVSVRHESSVQASRDCSSTGLYDVSKERMRAITVGAAGLCDVLLVRSGGTVASDAAVRQIYYADQFDAGTIKSYDLAMERSRTIVSGCLPVSNGISLSRDESKLAFAALANCEEGDALQASVVNTDGTGRRALGPVQRSRNAGRMAFAWLSAPLGVLVQLGDAVSEPLVAVELDSGLEQRLGDGQDPVVSPALGRIAFERYSTRESASWEVWVLDSLSASARLVLSSAQASDLAGVLLSSPPSSSVWSDDGEVLWIAVAEFVFAKDLRTGALTHIRVRLPA